MKKSILAAALGLVCATAAHADDVAVWGRVGGGVNYLSGVQTGPSTSGSKIGMGNNWGTSILGFKGREDLGGGTNALFWLEAAFNSKNGISTGGKLFQRGSWVALQNNDYGLIRFGQGNFINNYIFGFDPFLLEDISASTFTSYRNGPRLANGIRYESPNMSGFTYAVQVNLGEGAAGFKLGPADSVVKNGLADGLTVSYKNGGFEVRAIWDEIRNANGKFDNIFIASKEAFVGAKYKLGATTLQAGHSHYSAPDTDPGLSNKADHTWIGVQHDLTSAMHLQTALYSMKVGDGKWTNDHAGAGRGTMLVLGGMYDLSKRTFLYATAAHVSNSSTANFSVMPTSPGYGSANGNGTSPAPGRGQTGFYAGVETQF